MFRRVTGSPGLVQLGTNTRFVLACGIGAVLSVGDIDALTAVAEILPRLVVQVVACLPHSAAALSTSAVLLNAVPLTAPSTDLPAILVIVLCVHTAIIWPVETDVR